MRRKLAVAALAVLFAASLCGGGTASAQLLDTRRLNVVGTWSVLTNWQRLEQPLWTMELPEASGGRITANLKSITELNLKGTELLRLLKMGVVDVAAVLPVYVDDGGAVIEAVDIAGVARNARMARDIVGAWMPEMQRVMRERHNAVVLGSFAFPEQVVYCRGDIAGIGDLKGKRIRVAGASQGDLVAALGGTAVAIPFGEVLPALEKGEIDCAITGTMPGYKARWAEAAETLFRLPVGYAIGLWVMNRSVWDKLPKDTQAFLAKEMQAHEDKAWRTIEGETEDGVACSTGTAACPEGVAGRLKLVQPSESDLKARETALNEAVLARWAKRCGAACAVRWNELVGQRYGLVAKGK